MSRELQSTGSSNQRVRRAAEPGDIVHDKRLVAVLDDQVRTQQAAYPAKRQRGSHSSVPRAFVMA